MKDITFKQFKKKLLYHRIVEWNKNTIILDNGIIIDIEETAQDCCASAGGEFTNVTLEAVITSVSEPKYKAWENGDTYGCSAVVKFLHNQNLICQANADADAGNGGYYFSVASFVITEKNKQMKCHFVRSDDD
jgi:hypothetical protein